MTSPSCSSTPISYKMRNFDDSCIFKADIALLVFAWIFRTSWPKIRFFWGQNAGRGGVMLTPNELDFTFGGSYICANFGEN